MARPDIVFLTSMADFLANLVEISFGSFSTTFTAIVVVAPSTTVVTK
jgi:hypothetical protein